MNLLNVFSDIKNYFEIKPRYLFCIFFSLLILDLLPLKVSEYLGLQDILIKYKGIFWCVIIIVFVIWIIKVFFLIYDNMRYSKKQKTIINNLNGLTKEEKNVLESCLKCNERTIFVEISDPIAHALTNKGLLIQSSGIGDPEQWPYEIPVYIWEYIKRNAVLLK